MKRFESIKIGDKAELTHTITHSDINQFVKLTGDDNKLHVDRESQDRTYSLHHIKICFTWFYESLGCRIST